MSLAVPISPPHCTVPAPNPRLRLKLARHQDELEAAQRLRYQVFTQEYGIRLAGSRSGLDADAFDPYCEHLLVIDDARGAVVGTYRLLRPEQHRRLGCYYAEQEFDLTRILALPARLLELGRSCVHDDYRSGAVIALLWSGLANLLATWRIDALMGCASVPSEHGAALGALYAKLAVKHLAASEQQVTPRRRPPQFDPGATTRPADLPPLLKGYLRAGAQIGGEPAWDPDFKCADFFLWLPSNRITARYQRHFLREVK